MEPGSGGRGSTLVRTIPVHGMRPVRRFGCIVALAALVAAAGCESGGSAKSDATDASQPPAPTRPVPGSEDRVTVHGDARLDGAPFDSRFVGAVVMKDGLATPCQRSLPTVRNGRFTISVAAETEWAGCGTTGAEVALWTFVDDQIHYSTNTLSWPGDGVTATFAPRYATATPAGAVPETAQFTGKVFGTDRQQIRSGAEVEAYVGETRCGVASVRTTKGFSGYILAVVGPESIPGCTRGAPLAFRVDGQPALSSAVVNTPPGQQESLDLSIQ